MMISKTPYRISFLGGGSDYNQWLEHNKGIVFGTTIDKYSYIFCRTLPPFFNYKSRMSYSEIETVQSNTEIKHNAIRKAIEFMRMENEPLEISHISDLPSFTGLGTSSSFLVGLLNALHFNRYGIGDSSINLAKNAIYVEQTLMGEAVGCQDQLHSAFGGVNTFELSKDSFIRTPTFPYNSSYRHGLEQHLLLIFTGMHRKASDIAKTLKFNKDEINKMIDFTYEGINNVTELNFEKFGKTIEKSWLIKKEMSSLVSNNIIDEMYDKGKRAGAFGGKISGVGNGGMLLFIAPPEKHLKIISAIDKLHIPIKISEHGSEIMVLK